MRQVNARARGGWDDSCVPVLARPRPIRTLLIALVAITQVPAILALGTLAYVQYLRQREAVEDNMVERSRLMAVAVRERIEDLQARLGDLALAVPDDPARLREFHALASSSHDVMGVDAIALVTRQGTMVMNTRVPWGARLPPALPGSLESFATGKHSVTDMVAGAVSGKQVTGVSVPVLRGSHLPYVLTASLDGSRFRELLEEQKLPPGWIGAVIDSKGVVVARVPDHDAYRGRRVTPDLAGRIVAAGTGSGPMVSVFQSRTLAGTEVETSMWRSPFNGWTVIVSVPRSLLVAPVWYSLAWAGGAFLLLTALSIGAALAISQRIAASVRQLCDAAAALPAGAAVEAGPMSFAEGEQLARTIADARQQIERAKERVEGITQDFHRTLMRELEARQRRTARELHDSVGSSLTGVSLLLAHARERATDASLSSLLAKAQEEVTRSSQEVREISRGMSPAGTEAGGLAPAIEHLASNLLRLQGVDCVLRERGDFAILPADAGTHLYRIVQEACANAIRHGGASAIRITLVEHHGLCRLTVVDNGSGCEFAAVPASHPGLGLRSMQARARAIEGRLEVSPFAGGGCRVRVTWKSPEARTAFANAQKEVPVPP